MLQVGEFNGLAPRVDPRALASTLATVARNCRFDRGVLGPLLGHTDTGIVVPGGTATLFPDPDGGWLFYADEREVLRSPIAMDPRKRLYSADATYPRVESAGASYRLGVPAAETQPVAAPDQPTNAADEAGESVVYVVTFVTAWGEEGPWSPASEVVTRIVDTPVQLTLPAPPAGNYNFGAGALTRIYRSNTGSEASDFQFVKDVAIGTANTTDDVPNADLQEVIPSADWIGPPDDDAALYPSGPLRGLIDAGNGVFAGFTGNTIALSEPYLPHAWPLAYRLSVTEQVVGLASVQQGILVLTTGRAYLIAGVHPESMTLLPVQAERHQACVARRSIVSLGDVVFWASPDGIAVWDGAGVAVATDALLSREQWQARYAPTTLRAWQHEGRYVASYDDGGGVKGLIFDPRGQRNALIELDLAPRLAYHDLEDDALYFESGGALHTWETDAANPIAYTWRSKPFVLPYRRSLSTARVDFTGVAPTLRLLKDGAVYHTTAPAQAVIRLPQARPATIAFELEGTAEVALVRIAERYGEVVAEGL